MRDIPMFTTENGVGSLILKEIAYCADAYVRVLDASDFEGFIKECYDFCKMAGARNVYFTGKNIQNKYPLHTEVWLMECAIVKLENTDAVLVPADASNIEKWRELYNIRMADVPIAAFMSGARVEELLKSGNAYFVYRDKALLGIGAVTANRIDCIASVVAGAGKDVLCALRTALSGDVAVLDVASENKRAISFYEKLGFIKTDVKEIWYKYIP